MSEFLNLRFLGTLFFWVGYHLSPWYYYLSGTRWESFLLVERHIDKGLLFSAFCMFAYLLGFSLLYGRNYKKYFLLLKRTKLAFPKVPGKLVVILIILSFSMFLIQAGGIDEIWRSSHHRGEGQFLKRDFWEKILHINSVLSTPVHTALACVATLYILQSTRDLSSFLLGWAGLLVSSFSSISSFSRGAGFSFIIFSFLALKYKGKKQLGLVFFSIAFAFFLGNVGLNERDSYYPGLGNFLDAAVDSSKLDRNKNTSRSTFTFNNPLDAMAPWTRKAEAINIEQPDILVMGPRFFWNINPLPSEIFPLAPLGRGLSEIMGTYGSTGITTPAFAEVYYVFGMWGWLLIIPLGMVYAWFERLVALSPGVISSICLLICFISLPIGLHSSMRAMSRPLVYAFFVFIFSKFLMQHKRQKKKHLHKLA